MYPFHNFTLIAWSVVFGARMGMLEATIVGTSPCPLSALDTSVIETLPIKVPDLDSRLTAAQPTVAQTLMYIATPFHIDRLRRAGDSESNGV